MRRFNSLTKWMIAVLAILTLFTVFSVGAYAAEEETALEKRQRTNRALQDMMDMYNGSEIEFKYNGVNAFNIIWGYFGDLSNIDKKELSQNLDSTHAYIELYYQRAVAVDRVAWICFPAICEDFKDDEDTKLLLSAKFKEIVDDIESLELAGTIEKRIYDTFEGDGFCAEMYVCLYTAKLNALREESDSTTASGIINSAIEKVKKCSVNTDNSEYEKILAATIEAVGIQRNQDRTIGELGETFGILFGDGFESNEIYAVAVKDIDDDSTKTIAQMNKMLLLSVKTAIDGLKGDGGKYVIEYYDSLKDVCDAADRENDTKIPDLSSIFVNYSTDLYRAETKDTVFEHISGKGCSSDEYLVELEKEYNSEGGILDGKMHIVAINLEADRAMNLSDLYERLVLGIDKIEAEKGSDASTDQIKAAFDEGESAIKGAADGQTLTEAFKEAMAAVAVEEYIAIYADTAAVDPEKVTVADKADVEQAIESLNSLDALAKDDSRVADAAEKLTELYKTIAKQEIEAALSGDGAHKDYADKLDQQIDVLTSDGIATLIEDTARVVGKAKPIDNVLDRYGEITLSDDYTGFTDKEKQKLSDITTDACDAIVDGVADVPKAAEDAITALNRSEAISRVTSKQREGDGVDLSAVEVNIIKIVVAATEMINAETEADKINDIADEAIFDIQKEFDVQSITDRVNELMSEIDKDVEFTAEQKQTLKSALQKLFDENAVRDAADEEARKAANDAFDAKLAEIKTEKDTKSAAMSAINDSHGEMLGVIRELMGLDEAQKEQYISKLNDEYEKACDDIISAETAEVGAVKNDVVEALELIGGIAKAIDTVNVKYFNAIEEIDGLDYLTDEEKQEVKAQLQALRDEAVKKLENALSADQVRDIDAEAIESLDGACANILKKDLENAKNFALSQIEEHGLNTKDVIGGLIYSGRGQVEKLNKDLRDFLEDAEEQIDMAVSSPDVDAIRDDVLAALESMRADALKNDDDACARIFTPIAVTLGLFAIAEVVAIVILDKKKKGLAASSCATAAAYAAVVPAMRTVPTAAWSVTLTLAIVDIVMAVMILRLIIQLAKLQAKSEEGALAYASGERAAMPQIDSWEDSESEMDRVFGSEPEYIPVSEPEIEEEPQVEEELDIEPEVEEEPQIEIEPEVEPEIEAEVEEEPQVEVEEEPEVEAEEICAEPICRVKAVKRLKIRQAIVNVDQLEKSFEAGDRVDMDALKDRGLISNGARCVKVLARGEIYKPLHVVARRFSATAKERIEKVGGRAECERD